LLFGIKQNGEIMAKGRRRTIIYDPMLGEAKKESFISTKLGRKLFDSGKKIERLPAAIKWLLTIVIGSFISGLMGLLITIYFDLQFDSLLEVSKAFRIQLIINVIIISMLAIFMGLLIREARS